MPRATDTTVPEPTVDYLVRMPEPWTHYFHVTMSVCGLAHEATDLVMPVWTPGSYLVREFARNVQGFSATDGSGAPLKWRKTGKNRWRVFSNRASELRATYQVYAFEHSVRTSFLDDTHGTINGASLFMFVEGHPGCIHNLRIEPFPSWNRITTGLEALAGEENSFRARDFDTLIDCPIEIGTQQLLEFTARGVAHRIAICGQGNQDANRLCADLQKVVERASDIIADVPYAHYTFLIHLSSEAGGGLEHANSALLKVNRWAFKPDESYKRFLSLAAHEYFHVWNVKRLRPLGLGPFDYTRENYTRQLWISEGFTDYYADLILRRAGLLTPEEYLEGISRHIKDLMDVPGRLVESVAEASFDAWIKFYRQDANFPNKSVSYYLKGCLIGLLLDLEIRNRAQGRSLDDVLRFLYAEYYRKLDRGFSEEEFQAACEEISGAPLERFFQDYCYGTCELDFARHLGYAGLRFKESDSKGEKPEKSYLGISAKTVEGRLLIVGVTHGSPAYEHGLNVNDEIVALDGFRMDQEILTARIGEAAPGTRMEFLISRDGRLAGVSVVLRAQAAREYKIERQPDPAPLQKRIYEEWLNTKWEEPLPEEKKQQAEEPKGSDSATPGTARTLQSAIRNPL